MAAREPEAAGFRRVLGHFCTGVTVITTADGGQPAGFACQAFAALSLAPPLVLFCPSRSSATWPAIERAGHFCANVLADGQPQQSLPPGRARETQANLNVGCYPCHSTGNNPQ